jgi:peptidoglycan/LPS O-acetylase OafA/YrhL
LVVAIRARATHQPIALPAVGKVFAHIFYLQDILGLGQFNSVFWTLCLEFQLYLVFSVMMRSIVSLGEAPRERSPSVLAEADKFGWLMVIAFFASLIVSHTVWPMLPGWFVTRVAPDSKLVSLPCLAGVYLALSRWHPCFIASSNCLVCASHSS